MALPSWVSQGIIQKSIQKYLHTSECVKVLSVKSEKAVSEGENYTSNLYRVTVNIVNKDFSKLSLIAKCNLDPNGTSEDLIEEMNIFEKEILMYTEIVPRMDSLMQTDISPKCLYASTKIDGNRSILIFEDLCQHKYQMANRHTGLDFEHCLKVIEKLAQMHVASIVVHQHKPHLFEMFQHGIFVEKTEMKDWVRTGFDNLIKACQSRNELKKHAYKLQSLGVDELIRRGYESTEKRVGQLHVLNHGDLWLNNMMFLYKEDKQLLDVKFIDLQLSFLNTPSIDLHYFIATSVAANDEKEFESTVDYLLQYYYAHLSANWVKLQLNLKRMPTKADIFADFYSRAPFGLMVAACVTPIIKADSRADANLENAMGSGDVANSFRHHTYNNDRYLNQMEILLNYYDAYGIMD